MALHRYELERGIEIYERTKGGDVDAAASLSRDEPGLALIYARVLRKMSQADLARRIGVHEQQVQRYESERYRSISLTNFRKVANALGVTLRAEFSSGHNEILDIEDAVKLAADYSDDAVAKVYSHAKKYGWIDPVKAKGTPRDALTNYISSTEGSNAALLRTGLNVLGLSEELSLLSWKSRVIQKAADAIASTVEFDPIDISWLPNLVECTQFEDGPLQAVSLLREKGIAVIVEPNIPGIPLDGAALMRFSTPVIGLTLRHDRLDNFWFTLLHEVGHVFLHYSVGLSRGFFDDTESEVLEGIEIQANEFSASVLIPPERWKSSVARISKSAEPIENFCKAIGIHPAIAFGRIRKERNNYKIFSDKLGAGKVRNLFFMK